MDVTPRPVAVESSGHRGLGDHSSKRRLGVLAVFAVLVIAVGLILFQALGSATTYYYNADEAVAKKAQLGSTDFRLQGSVVKATKDPSGATATFTLAFNGKHVDVVHQGDTPALFRVGMPVVVHGHWNGSTFASDQIEVKHSASYRADHPDRVGSTQP